MEMREDLLTERITQCIIEVHQTLEPGFLESIYRKAMVIELTKQELTMEQVRSYLKATGIKVAILVNFAKEKADFRKVELEQYPFISIISISPFLTLPERLPIKISLLRWNILKSYYFKLFRRSTEM